MCVRVMCGVCVCVCGVCVCMWCVCVWGMCGVCGVCVVCVWCVCVWYVCGMRGVCGVWYVVCVYHNIPTTIYCIDDHIAYTCTVQDFRKRQMLEFIGVVKKTSYNHYY